MNLISVSRGWLSKEDTHWMTVLYEFREFISSQYANQDGFDVCAATTAIDEAIDLIGDITRAYLKGNIKEALDKTCSLLHEDFYIDVPENKPMFRARGNDTGFLYAKEEMFHIPFEKRYLVGNQRYSLSGIPCLYLGSSTYVCWEELGRPDYQKCNYSVFKTNEVVFVYDFCLPTELKNIKDVRRAALILACSIPADSHNAFKPSYILPQCVLHAIIDKHYNQAVWFAEDDIFGIRYYSTHYLIGKSDVFTINDDDECMVSRMINYVFPSISESESGGLSSYLLRAFDYTPPQSIMHLSIKNAYLGKSEYKDEYMSSGFGAIEEVLLHDIGLEKTQK